MLKKENLIKILMIIVGSLIYSIGVNLFIVPHKLLSGGVAGIAIICQYLTRVPSGYFIILINIPIFLIGVKSIDKSFGFFSFIGMISMSVCLILTRNIHIMYYLPDPLLSALCGGIITGIGMGIIFKNRASQGGTDIIAVVVKKKYGVSIGRIAFLINVGVVTIGMIIGSFQIAIYTLISMYLNSAVLDKIIQGVEREKVVFIVTRKSDKVKDEILKKLNRGVTYLYGEGAYTGDKKNIIYCILSPKEIEQVKGLIENIDDSAVISIMDTAEVKGKGFRQAAF
ncbi:YitT family protein [Clostridium scatologenes]|uniref:Transporter protein n=1 Tax=Clostridium scatologenes TaxID=1548 RepID=A0A0E3JSB3_CLOSL|nr:YitT family protein [Clostridium scatologenes]AKA72204.1 transporter protein [Clostridium scatologenes]